MDQALVRQLASELSGYGIDVREEQAILLVRYLDLVIEKNKVVNLTRITQPSEAVTLHLVDSILPLASDCLHLDEGASLLDMGTGAGFPGVPIAVLTGARSTLVDSVRKKTDAVSEFVHELGIENVIARHARLEDLAREMPASQDVVFARALARTNILMEYATPFLRKNGLLVVEKARPDDDELREAQLAARICGLKLVSRETYELPHQLGHREILFYQKVRAASIKLPRRIGLARSQPLGL